MKIYNYEKVSQKIGFADFLPAYLASINYIKPEQRETFSLNIPFFNDESKFENLLKEIKETNGKIGFITDYDVDGIMSSTVGLRALRYLRINVELFVPNRFKDGYGLSKGLVDKCLEAKCNYILTADNGIVAFDAIEYAYSKGLKVIVTDHHRPSDKLPKCELIINSQIPNTSNIKASNVCGALTLFFLFRDILRREKAPESFIESLIEYAGIATIADQMPLEYENLKAVKFLNSMYHFHKNKSLALDYLMKKQFVTAETISMTDWNFQIIPCLNATGRLEDATIAVDLLATDDLNEIIDKTNIATTLNSIRKEYSKKYARLAINYLNVIDPNRELKISVVLLKPTKSEQETKLEGIIGLVAQALVEEYERPAFVGIEYEKDGKKAIKVSGRSYGDFDLYNFIKEHETEVRIQSYGGHAGAMGLNFENILNYKHFNYILNSKNINLNISIPEEQYIKLPINADLNEIYKIVKKNGPYGQGFEKPMFIINAELMNYTAFSSIIKNFERKIFGNVYKCKSFSKDVRFENIVNKKIYFSFEESKNGFELEVLKMEEEDK